ncbi:phage holin family protein [Halarcobacter sp.]|uniref:phage holin family protein n=1 Tax=Halarcobacter sp. TaxID=2321133 RepID=UPI0029F52330|nr:phage holin family protein [Halarcobacter sp.]
MEVITAFFTKYMWVILYVSILSFAGGITSYIRKSKAGLIDRFSLSEFIGDMFIAAFVGVVTYLICKGVGLNELVTAGVIGITSHMGTKAIVFIEAFIPKVANKYFKIEK